MSAEEAKTFGIIDEVVPERKTPGGAALRKAKSEGKDDKDKEKEKKTRKPGSA